MAKAKPKSNLSGKVISSTQLKDLSVEKRVELFNKEFEDFKTHTENNFGLKIDVEIVFNKKGIIPRVVLVDLLARNPNAPQPPKENGDKETESE